MVEMALGQLSAKNVVTLDEERKAFSRMPNVDAICKSARTGAVQRTGDRRADRPERPNPRRRPRAGASR